MRSTACRAALAVYALAAYLLFLGTFTYAIGFVGGYVVPKTVDSSPAGGWWPAIVVDAGLLGLFAVQHSVMARPAFKRWWTRIVPAPAERSTYVLLASLALVLAFWQWRAIAGTVWNLDAQPWDGLLVALSLTGWVAVVAASWMIHHFDLFGVRQAFVFMARRAYTPVPFTVRGAYGLLRQPMMLGLIVAFWATPRMSAGHLLFAALATGYILVGVRLEERDIAGALGPVYDDYRQRVPMFLPRLRRGGAVRSDGRTAQPSPAGPAR